jgi:hypothetical protein
MEIYNTMGQKLYSQKIYASKTAVNSGLTAGAYFFRIVNAVDNTLQCEQLIIAK